MDLEFFTPEQKIVQEKIKNEIKMLGIAISEDLLEGIFYDYFVKYQAWNEVLDELLGNELPSDQLDKLKQLNSTIQDLTMKIASEPQNQTKDSAIHSLSLEEAMIVEEDPVPSDEEDPVPSHEEDPVASNQENPVTNEEDSTHLLIEELEEEKAKFESLFSTQNIPNVKEIAEFCDKLTSAEQIKCPRQSEIKEISAKFVDQVVKFAESIAEVIKNQFLQQLISEYIYAFAIIENPFKVLSDLTKIPKVSNSLQLQTIFWNATRVVVSKVKDAKEAALNIISEFYPNGSKREYNEALTCYLEFLEKAKWIDNYVKLLSCQQFSSEIKKEIVDCVEKFTKDIKKIDLNDEKNKWIDETSAIELKVNTLLPLRPLSETLEHELTKFSQQVQDKKATFFANITKEFSMDRLTHMEPNSLNISKAVTALEGLRKIEDCDQDDQYKSANTALDKYLKGYFTDIIKCFQQLKTAIDNVINPKNYLKDSLEFSLDIIRKNSKIITGYLDKLKQINDKYPLLHAFIPEEEVDSSLRNLRNLRKSLAIEVEILSSQTHSTIGFLSKLQLIKNLMELDLYISSDGESFSQLYRVYSQSYEGQIQKIFNEAILDLKKDKLESVVVTMKELEPTSPQLFSKLQMYLKDYINDLVNKIKEEAASLSPSLPMEQSEWIANLLKALKKAKTHIPKEYLSDSYNEIVDCISNYADEDDDDYDYHEDEKPTKKSTGLKKKPSPPKKPLTAFFLFKADIYEQVKKQNPDLKMTELTKIISERWNNIDSGIKSKYEKKNKEANQKYEKEVKAYVKKYGELEKRRERKAMYNDDDDHEDEKLAKKSEKRPSPQKKAIQPWSFSSSYAPTFNSNGAFASFYTISNNNRTAVAKTVSPYCLFALERIPKDKQVRFSFSIEKDYWIMVGIAPKTVLNTGFNYSEKLIFCYTSDGKVYRSGIWSGKILSEYKGGDKISFAVDLTKGDVVVELNRNICYNYTIDKVAIKSYEFYPFIYTYSAAGASATLLP